MKSTQPVSRAKKLHDQGAAVPMPPLSEPAQAVLGHLLEVGPAVGGGMGLAPLSFTELQAYQQAAGYELTPWEARTLRRLSQVYVAGVAEAEDPNMPPPWAAPRAHDRNDVEARIRAVFGSRARRRH